MSSLDNATDPHVEALAALAQAAANAKLMPMLGTDAIKYIFGTPLPLSLLGNKLPALCVYRLEDRDRDLGEHFYEDTNSFRFDYYAPSTPLTRLDKRWPLLRNVWVAMLAGVRSGSHPDIDNGRDLGVGRYVLGSGKAQYAFVPGAQQTYAGFRGTIEFEACYDPPEGFDGSRLDDFLSLYTDWDFDQSRDGIFEASNITRPNG